MFHMEEENKLKWHPYFWFLELLVKAKREARVEGKEWEGIYYYLLYTYWKLFTPRGENINRISLITDYIDQSDFITRDASRREPIRALIRYFSSMKVIV